MGVKITLWSKLNNDVLVVVGVKDVAFLFPLCCIQCFRLTRVNSVIFAVNVVWLFPYCVLVTLCLMCMQVAADDAATATASV